jgi:hypothetical protein
MCPHASVFFLTKKESWVFRAWDIFIPLLKTKIKEIITFLIAKSQGVLDDLSTPNVNYYQLLVYVHFPATSILTIYLPVINTDFTLHFVHNLNNCYFQKCLLHLHSTFSSFLWICNNFLRKFE